MRPLLLVFALGVLAACHHDKPPVAPRLIVEKRPCLVEPPPPMEEGAVEYERPKEDGSTECAEGYVACIRRPGFTKLIKYLDDVYTWSRDAFTACGPTPVAPPPVKPDDSAPAQGETL